MKIYNYVQGSTDGSKLTAVYPVGTSEELRGDELAKVMAEPHVQLVSVAGYDEARGGNYHEYSAHRTDEPWGSGTIMGTNLEWYTPEARKELADELAQFIGTDNVIGIIY